MFAFLRLRHNSSRSQYLVCQLQVVGTKRIPPHIFDRELAPPAPPFPTPMRKSTYSYREYAAPINQAKNQNYFQKGSINVIHVCLFFLFFIIYTYTFFKRKGLYIHEYEVINSTQLSSKVYFIFNRMYRRYIMCDTIHLYVFKSSKYKQKPCMALI